MGGKWKEVVRLHFKGERFRDHALDLSALSELRQFQKIVAETAKALWRAANPDRERLPPHFQDRTRLCLREIADGSATTPLEVYIDESEKPGLWEQEPDEVNDAINLAYDVFEAIREDAPLPERLPKELLPEYTKWGQDLTEDEVLEFSPSGNGSPPTRVTKKHRGRFAALSERPYQDQVDVTGEVLEADVKREHFELWIDDRTSVRVTFTEQQEGEVTTALKEHQTVRLRVEGRGERSLAGVLQRITTVDKLTLIPHDETPFDPDAPPIEDVLAELAKEVPEEEWENLPTDLTDNLDHYLYGTPKE